MIEPLLLCAARIVTFQQNQALTNASSFFFKREGRLFLVTSRHVFIDKPSKHFPDRIEIELHTDRENMVKSEQFSVSLYAGGKSVWRQGSDSAGDIDVAVIELDLSALPESAVYCAFTPAHLPDFDQIEIGTSLLVVGFPLGFHDTLHHMPVVRHAISASSFGLRFQGKGYFLTDARTHRGTSGAPVVMRAAPAPDPENEENELHWLLLGVHSARLDVDRDRKLDEALGLNCAWYADILLKLTET